MSDQEKKEPNNSTPQSLRNKQSFKKWSTRIAYVLAVVASIVTILDRLYPKDVEAKNINGYYEIYDVAETIAFSGEISNKESLNANGLTFKGKFDSEIISFDISTLDSIENLQFKNPPGIAEFSLKRLSKGNNCTFDIIVYKGSKLIGPIQVSWNGGKTILSLRESDNRVKRGIELREKVENLEPSLKARQKWFENNTKNIRKVK